MGIKLVNVFSFEYHKGRVLEDFSHNANELILIFRGKGEVVYKDRKVNYGPNTLMVFNAFDKRTQRTTELTEYMCIRYLDSSKQFPIQTGVYACEDKSLHRLFTELRREYASKERSYFEYCNLIIQQVLITITRMETTMSNHQDIYSIIQAIDESKGYIKSIKEMAEESAYSYDHFRHKFKQITGQSPTDYIMNKRIEYACQLLSEGTYTCTEVSSLSGFSTPAQSSSIFKKKMGISPKHIKICS